ncbi:MAG: NUDIX domain-containing protein [Bacilli bacterium]
MIKEQSYGAVVYRLKNGNIEILVEDMTLGHISIPKGHIEAGETPEICTLREIKEETNLDVDLDTNFSHTITYSPKPDVTKDVTFFVARATSDNVIVQPEEVRAVRWLAPMAAMATVTFQSDRTTILLAFQYLEKYLLHVKR